MMLSYLIIYSDTPIFETPAGLLAAVLLIVGIFGIFWTGARVSYQSMSEER